MPPINILFPAQIDNPTSLPLAIDGSPISAQLINTLRAAILAIENTLGVNPGSVYGTVRARLDVLENLINNQETIVLTGDLGGTLTNPKVVGIQGIPVVSTHPNVGDALVFNGSFWGPEPIVEPSSYTTTLLAASNFAEIGQVIMNPIFSATYSNIPTSGTIQDNKGGPLQNIFTAPTPSIPPNIIAYNQSYISHLYTNPPFSVVFTLSSSDGADSSITTASITWVQNVYFGVGVAGGSDQNFIKSLNAILSDTKVISFTTNSDVGQYIYFAYRSAYGAADFWAYGWEGGFNLVSNSISLTNSQGFTENYTLYKSNSSNLGTTTVNVF